MKKVLTLAVLFCAIAGGFLFAGGEQEGAADDDTYTIATVVKGRRYCMV